MRRWLAAALSLAGVMLAADDGSAATPEPGMLLVARTGLADIRFRETVVLVLRHDPEGSAGLILNRPSRLALAEVLPGLPAVAGQEGSLSYGGPVAPRAFFVLVRAAPTPPDPAQRIFASVYLSGPGPLSAWLASDPPVAQYRVFTGYAGWAPGQLDGELARGDWQVLPADERVPFSPEVAGLWEKLVRHEAVPAP